MSLEESEKDAEERKEGAGVWSGASQQPREVAARKGGWSVLSNETSQVEEEQAREAIKCNDFDDSFN